jgi:phosphatidylglycerophosphatase A
MIFFENSFYNIIIGFVIFRFFDILKPFPINIIDKKIKNGFGVIFDDLLAGIYSGVTLYSINYVL